MAQTKKRPRREKIRFHRAAEDQRRGSQTGAGQKVAHYFCCILGYEIVNYVNSDSVETLICPRLLRRAAFFCVVFLNGLIRRSQ